MLSSSSLPVSESSLPNRDTDKFLLIGKYVPRREVQKFFPSISWKGFQGQTKKQRLWDFMIDEYYTKVQGGHIEVEGKTYSTFVCPHDLQYNLDKVGIDKPVESFKVEYVPADDNNYNGEYYPEGIHSNSGFFYGTPYSGVLLNPREIPEGHQLYLIARDCQCCY